MVQRLQPMDTAHNINHKLHIRHTPLSETDL